MTIERGMTYLLKQAQLLAKYEEGPSIGYIFREQPNSTGGQCQMLKVSNILGLQLSMPLFNEIVAPAPPRAFSELAMNPTDHRLTMSRDGSRPLNSALAQTEAMDLS